MTCYPIQKRCRREIWSARTDPVFSKAINTLTLVIRRSSILSAIRRDVVLSEYYFDIKRRAITEDYPLQQFVSRFVRGELNHPYGTWGENAASWFFTRRGDPRFLLITYEALQSEGMKEMGRIASFLGVSAGPEQLAFAIEQSSANRMRELEKKQSHLWSSTRETRKDKPFVRTAKAGGWKAELSEASIGEIESAWGGLMREMGYELAVSSLVHAGMEKV